MSCKWYNGYKTTNYLLVYLANSIQTLIRWFNNKYVWYIIQTVIDVLIIVL